MPPQGQDRPLGGRPRLVCRCIGVSSCRIIEAVRAGGLTRVSEVQEAVKAGTGCCSCHPEIEEILAELRGLPISRLEQMQSAMVCRDETQQRIEASLLTGIVPKLPPGCDVEIVSVQGLEVGLHLQPDREDLRELVSEKLRKFVCADLEISFS